MEESNQMRGAPSTVIQIQPRTLIPVAKFFNVLTTTEIPSNALRHTCADKVFQIRIFIYRFQVHPAFQCHVTSFSEVSFGQRVAHLRLLLGGVFSQRNVTKSGKLMAGVRLRLEDAQNSRNPVHLWTENGPAVG